MSGMVFRIYVEYDHYSPLTSQSTPFLALQRVPPTSWPGNRDHHLCSMGTLMKQICILNVVVDKSRYDGCDVFEMAWNALIQRYEHVIERKSFEDPGTLLTGV